MSGRRAAEEAGGVELLEEAVQLLRAAPSGAWLAWLAGIVPFVSALLWFGADALLNPASAANLPGAAFVAAAAFVWKQWMESLFLSRLRAALAGAEPRTGARVALGALTRQAAVQSLSLLTLPFGFCALIAAAPAVFFHRNFSLLAWDDPDDAMPGAWRLARSHPRQAWMFLAMVALVWILAYVNLLALALTAAQLSRSIFGVEQLLAHPLILLRSGTVHWGVFIGAYAAADLLLDAGAAVRCFRGGSARTGEDILAAVRRIAASVAIFAILAPAAPAFASVEPAKLDESIERTLRKPEFAWRMPAARNADAPTIVAWVEKGWHGLGYRLGRAFRALADWLFRPERTPSGGRAEPGGDPGWTRWLLIALAVVAAAGAAFVLVRARSARQARADAIASPAAVSVDLEDRTLLPDRLTEDSWLKLADEWIVKGDYRLALRAMHLAGLRMLSERRLITIQRWKTCADYSAELRRKSRHAPKLSQGFEKNARVFDLGWYGFRGVEIAALDEFRSRLEEIRADAG